MPLLTKQTKTMRKTKTTRKRKLNNISGGSKKKMSATTKRYKKRESNFAFTNKTKRDTLMRQGRFCSNYPNSPLSKLLGNHCDTYNNFDRKCMFLPGTEQYDHFVRREKSMNNTTDNCNILCCSCHSLKTKMDGKDEWQQNLRKIMKAHTQNFKKNFLICIKEYIETKHVEEHEKIALFCDDSGIVEYLKTKYNTLYDSIEESFDKIQRNGQHVIYVS